MTYAEILGQYHHIGQQWRTASVEQRTAAVGELDQLLGELSTAGAGEDEVDLRGRIGILMDEMEIYLGMDLPDIPDDTDVY